VITINVIGLRIEMRVVNAVLNEDSVAIAQPRFGVARLALRGSLCDRRGLSEHICAEHRETSGHESRRRLLKIHLNTPSSLDFRCRLSRRPREVLSCAFQSLDRPQL
jgi:hypothetical protein